MAAMGIMALTVGAIEGLRETAVEDLRTPAVLELRFREPRAPPKRALASRRELNEAIEARRSAEMIVHRLERNLMELV